MRRPLLLIGWLLTDVALFVAAYALAYFLRVGWILSTDFPFDRFIVAVLIAVPVWMGAMITTRVFSLTRKQTSTRSVVYILYASLIGIAAFTLAYYFLFNAFFSRMLLLLAFVLTGLLMIAWHVTYEGFQRRILRTGAPVFPTLLVGVTRESAALIAALQAKKSPLKPVAILDGHGVKEKEIAGVPVLGKLNKLEETLEKYKITHLIQGSDVEQTLNLLSACRQRGVTYMLMPSVLGIVERDERIETLEGFPVTVVSPAASPWMWFFR